MYDRDLELTRHEGESFLYKQVYLSYVITYSLRQNTVSTTRGRTVPTYPVTGLVETVHGVHRDSVKGVRFTGS